jgi:hypothetical protein
MIALPAIWNAITPSTLTVTAVVAIMFAAFLWHAFPPRVTPVLLFTIWLGTITFIGICGSARYFDGSPTWETYIGSAVLWTWYVAVTALALWTWRRVRRRLE